MLGPMLAALLLRGFAVAGPRPPSEQPAGAVSDRTAEDEALLYDLELLRNYDLLKVYPLLAPLK